MTNDTPVTTEKPLRSDLTADWFGDGQDPAAYDPVRSARGAMKTKLPKRFYTDVTSALRDDAYCVLLDGKPARTKGRALLAVQNAAIAALLVVEWAAQVEVIDPSTMPMTRMVHTAIDHVAEARQAVLADILNYARTDATCYRAGDPAALVALETRHWDPVLEYIRVTYGARFVPSEGIAHVAQPDASIAALEARLSAITSPVAVAALHVLTTISGSALIAIAVADGFLDADAGYDAGEVDGDYEVSVWGSDDEATDRRANRLRDFRAAVTLLRALVP